EMFEALREHVFPEIHARKRDQPHLRIWSAGCSIGAEPYSLSILLRDELAHYFQDWTIEIIGTDINRRFLQIAREAAYESWALRGMSEERLHRCFEQQGKKWALKRRFTEGVTFQHHNLVRDRFPSLGNNLFALDIAICRNVMIYFSNDTVRQLAEQFHQSLIPGGWLAVGHAEPHTETFRAFRTVNAPGAILYQRTAVSNPAASGFEWLQTSGKLEPVPAWQAPVLNIRDWSMKAEALPSPTIPAASNPGSQESQCMDLESVRGMADAGELVTARACCEHLLQTEKLKPEAHLLYALILEQLEVFDAAREALRRAIYLDRTLVLGHYHLGIVQLRLGEMLQAMRSLRNARALTEGMTEDEPVRYGDGMTIADLRSAIAMHLNHMPDQPDHHE
ncbi:MAG: protein-glutamate O-methyltransferase CheR, partial [Verrucomicrobiaceae bacterium]